MRLFSFVLAATALAAPALAQQEPPAPTPMTGPASAAAQANNNALAVAQARPTIITPGQADYDAAVADYRSQMRAYWRAQAIDRQVETAMTMDYQRANARAAAAWRQQVADCRRGNRNACRAPTLQPADFL